MIAKCTNPNCGKTFETRDFGGQNSDGISYIGNTVYCPYCNSQAKVEEGTFNFDENGITTLLKELPKEDLIKIQEVVKTTLSENKTVEEFKKSVENINPKYVTLFENFINFTRNEDLRYWLPQILAGIIIALTYLTYIETKKSNEKQKESTPTPQKIEVIISYTKDFESNIRARNLRKVETQSQKKTPKKRLDDK